MFSKLLNHHYRFFFLDTPMCCTMDNWAQKPNKKTVFWLFLMCGTPSHFLVIFNSNIWCYTNLCQTVAADTYKVGWRGLGHLCFYSMMVNTSFLGKKMLYLFVYLFSYSFIFIFFFNVYAYGDMPVPSNNNI